MHYSFIPPVFGVIIPAVATYFIIKYKLDQSPKGLYQ